MSESREDSYYEVALSHRQVVWVFVVLLGCVVSAFLAGVWIGQRQEAAAPQVVVAGVEQPAAEGEGERELEELHFFSDAGTTAKPAVPQRRRGTTLADDLGAKAPRGTAAAGEVAEQPAAGETTATAPAVAPPAVEAPAASPPAAEPPRAVDPAPAPAPPADEPAAAPAAETASAAPAGPAPGSGDGLVIQVFSSPEREQAQQVVERLVGGGHPAFLSPVEVEGRTMYRVRIGPFAERARAESVAESVRRSFRLDTWITANS